MAPKALADRVFKMLDKATGLEGQKGFEICRYKIVFTSNKGRTHWVSGDADSVRLGTQNWLGKWDGKDGL